MSSAQSRFSQISPREKNLLVTGLIYGYTDSDITTALATAGVAYTRVGSRIQFNSAADVETFYKSGLFPAYSSFANPGALLKDLGKEIILSANGTTVVTLRQVQLISGPLTEGVPRYFNTTDTFYITMFQFIVFEEA
jgi:hypothetical protein